MGDPRLCRRIGRGGKHAHDEPVVKIDRAGATTTAPDYSDANIVGGKNPAWNRYGHERMGWALSVFNKAAP